jgi:hypothetical protein
MLSHYAFYVCYGERNQLLQLPSTRGKRQIPGLAVSAGLSPGRLHKGAIFPVIIKSSTTSHQSGGRHHGGIKEQKPRQSPASMKVK